MRLIDADALLEDIGEEPMNWTNSPEEIQEYSDWKRTVAIINSAPTIEAEPVRHCKWAFNSTRGGVYGRCTSCKEVIYLCGCFNYCPNCGAKVDGETYEANEDEVNE